MRLLFLHGLLPGPGRRPCAGPGDPRGGRLNPIISAIGRFDRAVDGAVDRVRSPALDRFFYPLSSAADHSLLWVAIGSTRQALGRGRPGSAWRLAAILAAESALTNGLLKSCFRRLRPILAEAHLTGRLPFGLRRPVTTSFPSGHATSAFTASAYLARGDRLAPAYRTLAVLVAGSRVYVRLHHASDVVAGAVIGIGLGRIARRFAPVNPDPAYSVASSHSS